MRHSSLFTSALSRRALLFQAGVGFGGLALWGLLARGRANRPTGASRGKARSVIFLYMEGGPSHVDTFDPKPVLARRHGERVTIAEGETGVLMKSPFKFARHGESGAEISEIFPHLAARADDLAIVRSLVSSQFDHAAANLLMTTGHFMAGRASMGAWVLYGLGSGCEDLPGYVVLGSGKTPAGGMDCFGSGFLPTKYQCTLIGPGSHPVANLKPREVAPGAQREQLALLERLTRHETATYGTTSDLDAVVASYELAFRMQTSVPDLLDLAKESQATRELYGLDDAQTTTFGAQCLRARALVERGVRFVQVLSPSPPDCDRWDQHTALARGHRLNAQAVDKPIAGLLQDLKARGLLENTLVIWGGEFGRSPFGFEPAPGVGLGRNHNPRGFSMWLAGGGVRAGIRYGATDEFGHRAVDDIVEVHDLHATVLHLLGIDHTQLTFRHGGRDFRLTDVYGSVVTGLVA